jgi:hypothetical protein
MVFDVDRHIPTVDPDQKIRLAGSAAALVERQPPAGDQARSGLHRLHSCVHHGGPVEIGADEHPAGMCPGPQLIEDAGLEGNAIGHPQQRIGAEDG